jgi:hypothetical protein
LYVTNCYLFSICIQLMLYYVHSVHYNKSRNSWNIKEKIYLICQLHCGKNYILLLYVARCEHKSSHCSTPTICLSVCSSTPNTSLGTAQLQPSVSLYVHLPLTLWGYLVSSPVQKVRYCHHFVSVASVR